MLLGLPTPAYQSAGAAGMDNAAAIDSEMVIGPGAIVSVPCGFALAISKGYEGQNRPRSGLPQRICPYQILPEQSILTTAGK